jgi:hypothetical protein
VPGFFGYAKVTGGILAGSPVAHGGQFGPTFIHTTPPVVPDLVIVAGTGAFGGGAASVGASVWNNGTLGPAGVGSITSGAVPAFITGGGTPIQDLGDAKPASSFGPPLFLFSYFGVAPQNHFTSLLIVELGVTLLTAGASDFSNGCGCGPNTIWGWPVQGLVNGNAYSFKFT